MISIYGVLYPKAVPQSAIEPMFDLVAAYSIPQTKRYLSYFCGSPYRGFIGSASDDLPPPRHVPPCEYGIVHTAPSDAALDALLTHTLDRATLQHFQISVRSLQEQFAIACVASNTIYIACNQTNIYYTLSPDDPRGIVWFSSEEERLYHVPFRPPLQRMPLGSVMDLATQLILLPQEAP